MNGRIYRVMLAAQARYTAPFLALAVVAAVAIPLLTVQGIGMAESLGVHRVSMVLSQAGNVSGWYPVLAVCTGFFLAVSLWLPDIAGRWVYVLTLPIDRTRLALLRLAAGATLILPIALVLWVMARIAVVIAAVPSLVRVYPEAIALRFTVATFVIYLVVGLMVQVGRKAWLGLAAIILLMMLQVFGVGWWSAIVDALFLYPLSPLHALAGQWLLFDV